MVDIILLDIDGVLNDHIADPVAMSSTILSRCVDQLNRILDKTQARVVLVSAWRYMTFGAMTLTGFEYLLRTHWIHVEGRLIDVARRDWEPEVRPTIERGRQAREWLDRHPTAVRNVVAIDDEDFGYTEFGVPLVQTDGKIGLTTKDADRAIEILTKGA